MAQQKPLYIQPLDIHPIEGGLDIQPLDIQPLSLVAAKPYHPISRPVADVFNTGIVPREKQPLLPYDPNKRLIDYSPLRPDPNQRRPVDPITGIVRSPTAGKMLALPAHAIEKALTPYTNITPEQRQAFEQYKRENPATGAMANVVGGFGESALTPALGPLQIAGAGIETPALRDIGKAFGITGIYPAMERYFENKDTDPAAAYAGLIEAGINTFMAGMKAHEPSTSPTPPKPGIKGTDPLPPTTKGGFGVFDTGEPTFKGVPSPEGVKSYFHNFVA